MPKLVHRTPAYNLHKSSGQAVVTLDGRDVYLGKHGTPESKRAYDRFLAEWLANGRRPPVLAASPPVTLTVDEVLAEFWKHAETHYRKDGRPTSEIHNYRQALRPLCALYGSTPAAAFGPLALKAVRGEMIRMGWCRRSINNNVSRIKHAFKWAVAEGLVPPAVLHGLAAVAGLKRGRTEARESDPVRPVPEAHVEAILPFLSRQLAAVVRLQSFTGARPGEALAMRACDLNTAGAVWEYRPASHKSEHHGRERTIFLGPRAQEIVKPFLKADLQAYLFDALDAENERNAKRREGRKTKLWPSHLRAQAKKKRVRARRAEILHGPYTREAYARAIRRACVLANVSHWHPHQLRHNAATVLRRELGIEAARVVLGHSSAIVTEIYAEVDRAKAKDAMGRLG